MSPRTQNAAADSRLIIKYQTRQQSGPARVLCDKGLERPGRCSVRVEFQNRLGSEAKLRVRGWCAAQSQQDLLDSVRRFRTGRKPQVEIRAVQDRVPRFDPRAIPEYLAKLGHPRGHLFVSRNRDSNNISQVQPSRSALEDRLVARKNLSAAHASIACRLAVPFPEEPGMIFHYPGADSGLEREPLGCCHQEPRDVSLPKLPCDRCRMRPQRAF